MYGIALSADSLLRLIRSHGHHVEVRREDLANWALQISPRPTFFFGVLWRMMCIHSDPWTSTISKKRFAHFFKKLHLRCYITYGMQYLHDMNCVVYAMVVMLRSNLIWTKLPCFKNACTPYWTINSNSSPFMTYSFLCLPKLIILYTSVLFNLFLQWQCPHPFASCNNLLIMGVMIFEFSSTRYYCFPSLLPSPNP